MTATATKRYSRDLLLHLAGRDVSASRIGDIVAEVESHVADTGEDPTDAFGTPKEYAEAVAPRADTARKRRGARALQGLCGGITGMMLSVSVTQLIQQDDTAFGMPTWVALLIGIAAAVATVVVTTGKGRGRIRDPRTGKALAPSEGLAFTLVFGVTLACLAVLTVLLP